MRNILNKGLKTTCERENFSNVGSLQQKQNSSKIFFKKFALSETTTVNFHLWAHPRINLFRSLKQTWHTMCNPNAKTNDLKVGGKIRHKFYRHVVFLFTLSLASLLLFLVCKRNSDKWVLSLLQESTCLWVLFLITLYSVCYLVNFPGFQ